MLIFRARFPTVTFRSEARNIGDASRFEKDAFGVDVAPAFRYKGVLFTDLKFDAQVIICVNSPGISCSFLFVDDLRRWSEE